MPAGLTEHAVSDLPNPAIFSALASHTRLAVRLDVRALVSSDLPIVQTDDADGAWNVLSDESRRTIFSRLAEQPRAVGELAAELPISRPAVSQHLRVLKTAGLVIDQVVGTRRIYRLNPAGVAALRDQLDTFWHRALAGYQDAVDQSTVDQPTQEGS